MPQPLTTFKGSHHTYTVIAAKDKYMLGLHTEFKNHPETGVGHIILRFVLLGGKYSLKHFGVRRLGEFKIDGKNVNGYGLNRFAIPVFSPDVSAHNFGIKGDEFQIWPVIAGWVEEQIKSEPGYVMMVENLGEIIRSTYLKAPEGATTELLLEFPSFKEEEVPAHKQSSDYSENEEEDDGGLETGE